MTRNDAQTSPWKMTNAEQRFDREVLHRKAEDERAVQIEVAGHGLEVNPAPDERERDRRREDAAPHDQPVRGAAQRPRRKMKRLAANSTKNRRANSTRLRPTKRGFRNDLPAAPPVHPRRRALEPHRVAVRDAERREERREGVADERRVEMIEAPRAEDDERRQRTGEEQAPCRRPDLLALQRSHLLTHLACWICELQHQCRRRPSAASRASSASGLEAPSTPRSTSGVPSSAPILVWPWAPRGPARLAGR